MKVSFASLSSAGPVRQTNEDSTAFWQPEEEEERQQRGSISIVADGVGGHGTGVASRMAVDVALKKFREASLSLAPKQLIKEMFETANLALYDSGENDTRKVRMATTLSVCIFRDKTLAIGHVGRHAGVPRARGDDQAAHAATIPIRACR